MDIKESSSNSSVKPSKELLYSEYTGTTVVEHVFESLEKKTNLNKSEEIKEFFKKEKNSGPLERARRLISLINGNEEKNVTETASDNIGDVDVVVEIGESPSGSDAASAWFILTQSNNGLSESLNSELNQNSGLETEKNLLEFESDSTDSFSDESDKFLSFSEKKIPNIVMENSSDVSENESETSIDSTDISDDENEKSVPSFTEKNFLNINKDNSLDSLQDESEPCNSISSKTKIVEIESNSLDCSDYESVSKQKSESAMNDKSSFVNENFSNCYVLADSDQNISVPFGKDLIRASEIFSSNSLNGHSLSDSGKKISAPVKNERNNSVETSKISPSDSSNYPMLANTNQYVTVPADVKELFSVKSSKKLSSDSLPNQSSGISNQNVSDPAESVVTEESIEISSNETIQLSPIAIQRKRKLSSIDNDSLSNIDSKDNSQIIHFSNKKNLWYRG